MGTWLQARLQDARTRATGWLADGKGVTAYTADPDAGQAGRVYGIRFIHSQQPDRQITVWWYPVEVIPGAYGVQREIDWQVCGDPQHPLSSLRWSDGATAWAEPGTTYGTPADAETAASRLAHGALAAPHGYCTWDGQPYETGA